MTWQELQAVNRVLSSFTATLADSQVRWFTGNQNVARIVHHDSNKHELQDTAVQIFHRCVVNNTNLVVEWIPRRLIEQADYIGRIAEYDDWHVDPHLFREIDSQWGPHQVDRFAADYNSQLPRFNSKFWCPGTDGVDAFCYNWHGQNNWCCPPVYLIPRVLRHARSCNAVGTLILPHWPSAYFWPLICPDGQHYAPFVVDWIDLPRTQKTIRPGKRGHSFFAGIPNTRNFAVRFNFVLPPRMETSGFCTTPVGVCQKCRN